MGLYGSPIRRLSRDSSRLAPVGVGEDRLDTIGKIPMPYQKPTCGGRKYFSNTLSTCVATPAPCNFNVANVARCLVSENDSRSNHIELYEAGQVLLNLSPQQYGKPP